MGIEDQVASPRVAIVDTENGESIEFPITPENLTHTTEASWTKQTVPSLSHQVNNFVNTNNAKFGFEIFADTLSGRSTRQEVETLYNFLNSMTFPDETRKATKYLLVWPGRASLLIIAMTIEFTETRWAEDSGKLLAFSAKLTIEEHRDVRISKEQVRARGLFRAGGSNPAR